MSGITLDVLNGANKYTLLICVKQVKWANS